MLKKEIMEGKKYSPVGKFAERAKLKVKNTVFIKHKKSNVRNNSFCKLHFKCVTNSIFPRQKCGSITAGCVCLSCG